jgi:hypothetical protein
MPYRVLKSFPYAATNGVSKQAEVGAIIDDLKPITIAGLTDAGHIEEVAVPAEPEGDEVTDAEKDWGGDAPPEGDGESEGEVADGEPPLENKDMGNIDTLRALYTELSGKKPFNGWDAATLREKIAELQKD